MKERLEPWWNQPWGPGKWQRRQVLGHLIDSAANNHLRFVRALIEPTLEGPGYDQEACVEVQNFAAAPLETTIALFVSYNRLLGHIIRQIPPAKLSTPCRIGGTDPVTLEALAIDYVDHLQHHLRQIAA